MRLRPSSAHVWAGQCAASVRLCEGVPDIEQNNDVREEGTACHWVAETLWQRLPVAVGDLAPNNVKVTQHMLLAAADYVDRLRSRGIPDDRIFIEQPLHARMIHVECGGKPDAVSIDWQNRIVYIDDLKYGYRFVEIFGNLQLLIYALAAAGQIPADWLRHGDWKFVLTIHQPRAYTREGPVREWVVTQGQLVEHLRHLQARASAAMDLTQKPVAGPACEDCRARLRCRAAQAAIGDVSHQVAGHLPNDLSFEQAESELARLRVVSGILEGYVTALEAQVKSALYAGQRSRFFQLEATLSNEQWKDEEARQKAIVGAKLYGVEIRKVDDTFTPKQCRDMLPRGVLDSLIHRVPGAAKIVPISAVKVQKALSK